MSAPTFTLVTSSDGCKSANLLWTPPTTTNVTVPIRGYTVHYQSYKVTFIVSYIVLEACTCHLLDSTVTTDHLLSLFLHYHRSFTITVPLLSLTLHITEPSQGGALISSNSLTGLSSNTTTATVEDLPTADYHVFQVGIPTVSTHTYQDIIQSHGWDPSILQSIFCCISIAIGTIVVTIHLRT